MKEADDPPLPTGYWTSHEQRCDFELANPSGGINGLKMAILLRAVEDGCNVEWLEEIARFYEIEVPEGMFRRRRADYVIVNQGTDRYIPVMLMRGGKQPLLSWPDALHPRMAFGG